MKVLAVLFSSTLALTVTSACTNQDMKTQKSQTSTKEVLSEQYSEFVLSGFINSKTKDVIVAQCADDACDTVNFVLNETEPLNSEPVSMSEIAEKLPTLSVKAAEWTNFALYAENWSGQLLNEAKPSNREGIDLSDRSPVTKAVLVIGLALNPVTYAMGALALSIMALEEAVILPFQIKERIHRGIAAAQAKSGLKKLLDENPEKTVLGNKAFKGLTQFLKDLG